MSSPLPLSLDGVTLARGGKKVLKDVSLEFSATPAKTVIIGPNGAGKSLLLQVGHGLVKPDRGRVRWAADAAAPAQAMVFQRPVMFRRSVLANLTLALKLAGVGRAERHDRAMAALQRTGLTRFADQPARSLSYGEQQRLALARALVVEPQVLFLDEPTASLDPAAAHLVESLIEEAAASGVRIIMISHDLGQTRRLADEVIFLHRGRVKERAAAAHFFAGPDNDLAAAFLKGELLWWPRRSIYAKDMQPNAGPTPGANRGMPS